jgi:hypothetical protein
MKPTTRTAYAVAARLMRFVQNRAEFDSIRDSPHHALAFREIITWANEQMGKPSVADMDRWESWAVEPQTKAPQESGSIQDSDKG